MLELCHALIEQVDEPMLLLDEMGELVCFNASAHELLGLTEHEEGYVFSEEMYVRAGEHRYDELNQWLEAVCGQEQASHYVFEPWTCEVEVATGAMPNMGRVVKLKRCKPASDRADRLDEMFMLHASAMMLVDPNTLQIMDANPAAAHLYKTTIDTLRRLTLRELDVESGEEMAEVYRRETIFLRPHAVAGSEHTMEIFCSAVPLEGDTGLFMIIHDVTQRERANNLLKAQERLMMVGEDAASVGSFEVNLFTGERNWSPQLYKIFGADRVLDFQTWGMRVHEEERSEVVDTLSDYARFHEPVVIEYRYWRTPHEMLHLETRFEVIRDQNDVPRYVRGTVQDVTELRHAEREAELYARNLEAANRSLEQFVSMASHDLQEPVRKVLTFGERLARTQGANLDDRGRDYLDRILSAGTRMRSMIESLLELSRCTAPESFETPIDLDHIIRDTISLLEVRIEEVQGEVVFEGGAGEVLGHGEQLMHLFQNLIGNALKFHKPDQPPRVVIFSELSPQGHRMITICDEGIGIPQEHAEAIFEPFKRLHGKKSSYEGSGIGLAICRKIVESHGGRIWVESEPGQGTRFHIELPVC